MRRRIGLLVVALALVGCTPRSGPRVDLDQLPSEPVAFVYIDPQVARDFAERMRELRGQEESAPGMAKLNKLQRLLLSNDEVGGGLVGEPSLLDPRTEERTPIEALPPGTRPLEWSSDHGRLLFSSTRFDHLQISQITLATGEVRTFTTGKGDHPSASLAPDGRLVFVSNEPVPGGKGRVESKLYVTNAGGGDPKPLTSGPSDQSPCFSPDGGALVYETRGPDGLPAIALLQPLDEAPKILARGRDPVFSPDGQWIVYSQRLAAGQRLWKMRPDGSGRLALGEAPPDIGEERHPAVSPDGRYVVYVAAREGRHALRIRRMDGGGDREFFETGDGLMPVW